MYPTYHGREKNSLTFVRAMKKAQRLGRWLETERGRAAIVKQMPLRRRPNQGRARLENSRNLTEINAATSEDAKFFGRGRLLKGKTRALKGLFSSQL